MRAVERRHLNQLCGPRDTATMVSSLQDSIYVHGKKPICTSPGLAKVSPLGISLLQGGTDHPAVAGKAREGK